MPMVTVLGAYGTTVSLAYDTNNGLFGLSNASLAQTLANVINAGITGGGIQPADNAYGVPPSLPPGITGELVISMPGVSSIPKGYDDAVVAATTAQVMGNGDPNEIVLIGSGNIAFYASGAAAGSGTIAGGGGENTIRIPASDAGAWMISLGDGNNTINASGGGADTITTGTGANQIVVGPGDDIISTAGTDTISAAGGGNDTVYASGSDVVYGGNTLRFVSTGNGSTVFGGAGSDTAQGHNGPDLFVGGSAGGNNLWAGTGPATLVGGGNGDQLYAAGAQPQILRAGAGAETLSGAGATGADTFVGGSGNTLIIGNATNDTFLASTGNATINAAPAAQNVFAFIKGLAGGAEFVENLSQPSQVALVLSGYGNGYSQQITGGALTVTLSDNTTITFQNIHSGTITNITSS